MPERSTAAGSDLAAARWSTELRARLGALRLSPPREAEIIEELSQHLDDRYRELLASGCSPDEATRIALGELKTDRLMTRLAPLRQANTPPPITAGAPGTGIVSDLWLDLRYAARALSRQRSFAAAAVLTLSLGIGATTAIFSVVYGVLLKPLPFADPQGLVALRHFAPHGAGGNHGPATYLTYQENQRVFESIGAWDTSDVSITGGGEPERVEALAVSASTLPILRVQPVAGRFFSAEDDVPGAPMRVILAHGYWQRRFGADPNVIGRSLTIDGTPAEVIGVLPASFTFLRTRPAVLVPMPLDSAAPRVISFGFRAVARLKPGVTLAQANADVGRMISLLPPAFARLELRPNVRPLAEDLTGDVRRILWILLAAVVAVLLIACANVANLFLVRAEGRAHELAIRAALGASRVRIARIMLSESVLLALAGGGAGLLLARGATVILRALAPADLPRLDEIGLDWPVLVFTAAISVASGLLFGLGAVLRSSNPAMAAVKEGGRSGTAGPARHRTRNALVVGQLALALTLLIVSGLMVRTLLAMQRMDPGYVHPHEVQTFVIGIPSTAVADPQRAARTFERIAARLSQVPGVTSVGLSSSITMDGEDNGNTIDVEGAPAPPDGRSPLWRFKSFAPGYFETMGNHMVAGRSITWPEIHEGRPVVVISEALAREYWQDASEALGQRLRAQGSPGPWREIVGVVGPERDDGLGRPPTPIVYWPMLNESYRWRSMAYAVRSPRVGTRGFLQELERAVWSVDPNLPLASVQTLDQIQARSTAQTAFALVSLGIAAAVALLIGVVGIYGVVAYVAVQRTREIGVRLALGATAQDVRTLFLRHGLSLAGAGIVLGTVMAAAATRVMSAYLFGVGPMDPLTYITVSVTLAVATLLAAWLPARGASRVDPVIALRAEA